MSTAVGSNIPDGLGEYLQSQFGGTLEAPQRGNLYGHSRDSSFKLTRLPQTEDSRIASATVAYYEQLGVEVSDGGNLCFGVSSKGFRLFVCLSNFTKTCDSPDSSRINGTVIQQNP